MYTYSEENYLKTIYELSNGGTTAVSTSSIALSLEMKAPSVTEMLKKLSDKGLSIYEKYQGCRLTEKGLQQAIYVVRKHRLWEVFLVKNLGMKWGEVHAIAEQLEHINSELLIERLDEYLGYPKFDPHGEPIPDKYGNIVKSNRVRLSHLETGKSAILKAVASDTQEFLQYLDSENLQLGFTIKVLKVYTHDSSLKIEINHTTQTNISDKTANNLLVEPI
ncbi:MAG: metal-dependent transcriptional regulator [Thermaurantimonas sp.]